MPVPYGFGVGDFVAVGTKAWNVYKSCRAAPGSFSNISNEVLSLHAVLKEADETIFRGPLSPESQARLKTIGDGCQCVLGDLQALVDKYESLGTQSKRTWDRMKWGHEDINEIRSRLISNATMLTVFISTSQTSVEQKLDKLINDIQQGRRAPSVVSLQTVDSLDPDDKEAWRTIRKELEDIGITVAAFNANKDFIFEKICKAVDTGEFQERAVSSPLGSMYGLDGLSSTSSLSSLGVQESNQTIISDTEPPKASEQASPGTAMAVEPHPRITPTKVPRVAALIATLTRPKKRLINAFQEDDVDKIKRLLMEPSTSRLIDRPTLNTALQSVSPASSKEAYSLLIDAGADINEGHDSSRPLTIAVLSGKQDLVAFFLDKGADVNYQSSIGKNYSSALRTAITKEDAAMITLLSQRGADINAVQPISKFGLNYRNLDRYPTGIHQASAESSTSIVDLLINLGANFTDSQGVYGTPLSLAIYKDRRSTVQLLIDKGADVNEVPLLEQSQFCSHLHIAIYCHSPDMVELLLKSGAVTDWYEAYDCAEREYKVISKLPLDNPRDPMIRGRRERTMKQSLAVMKLIKGRMDSMSNTELTVLW